MAKKALLDVLEQTIGKYVKNLDAESLNVAVWSGKIELHSLELDVESVNQELDKRAEDAPNLAVPFRVLSGRFESLEVVVPWAQITSRPVVLRARGLSIEVEPFDRSAQLDQLQTVDADDIATTASLRERREQLLETSNKYRLQAFAMKKIALSEADSESDPNSNAKSSFSSRLVRRIIENIQIEIEDVHVSLTDSDGSAGVVLGSLKLATTDKNGNQVFVDRTKDVGYSRDSSATFDMSFLYKVLQIEGLGVYLDEDQFMNAKSLLTISETGDDDDASSQNPTTLAHSFVLAPLSFEATLRQADSNDCVDYAKYMLRSQLSSLSVMLTRSQLDIARKISKAIDSPRRGPTPLFPEYRPLTKVRRGTAKDWWKYAVRCIGRLNGKRSWVEFILAHRKRKAYIPLFKRQAHYMTCSWLKPLSAEEMDVLIEIEHDRSISVEGLMAWRNIADAQIDKEREKYDEINKSKTKQSSTMYSYLFGSSSKGNSTSTPNNSELNTKEGEADDPPISLSPEEMRKLEGMEQAGFTENELSKESKLCDIEFVLAALKVDLVGYDLRLIASLAMGQVSVTFDAAMDGAYGFNFALSDLEIFDRCTPQSLFPSVLRTIDKREEKQSDAVLFNVTKSSSGDQGLSLKVSAFEAVASQLLVRELRRFLRETPLRSGKRANPLLAQSISGSVDLFYDADEGGSFQQEPSPAQNDLKPKPSAIFNRYDLSNALIDAWKEKTAAKVSWMLDLDVVAPVILVPETCNDPRANVLVFDLGNLKVNYGKYNPTFQVQQWFDQHPRETLNEETYDSGNIAINDLTFSVQKASLWQSLPSNKAQSIFRDAAVIQPTGVLIDFAIESIGSEGAPRFCSIGVIPTISLKLSPSQVSQILPVVNSWQDVVSDGDGSPVEAADRLLDSTSNGMPNGFAERFYVAPSSTLSPFAVEIESQKKSVPLAYCSIGLQRLSLVVADDKNNRLEAHLVSVYGSILQSSDGGSVSILRMGWFWILDWMTYDFPRRQRLLVHSTLPLPAQHFSDCEEYNILEELTKQGVFERDYSGSTALADVSYTTFSHDQVAVPEALVHEGGGLDARISIPSLLDVKFHSLLIHWNPQAIKEVTSLLSRFTAVGDDDDKGTVILSPSVAGTSERPGRVPSQPKHESSNRMLISARMESLDIVLNSARDDLPLFALTVSKARFSLKPLGSGQEIALSLGDLRVATPGKIGRTLPDYRTLLGLAPGTSESLLTINYYLGRDAVKTVGTPETEKYENLEALAHVEFSPMRFCYLHSQVMTLVEYITEGMLGAITAKAATSAAEAAKELANSVSGGSLFVVRATALDFLVPRAATSQELLTIRTTSLDVEYCMLPESGGSNARISLSDLFVADTCDEMLQEAPVQMQVTVRLPAFGIGTLVDQAMHVNVEISKASFVLTKDQYEQLMNTFDDNIGATDLFLRDDISSEVSTNAAEGTKPGDLTHAGVQFVERARRLYFVLGIKELSLKLQGSSSSDPLVRLAGVDARVSMKLFPDQRKSSTEVLLQNLVCEDCRLVALNRQYRYLIEQSTQTNEGEINSIFQIGYTTEESKSDIDVLVGSPQVVLIPDVISEVLAFVSSRKSKAKEVVDSTDGGDRNASILNQQIVEGDSREDLEEIETNRRTSNTTLSNFSAKTGTCRIVLVDLGSQLTIDKEAIGGSGGSSPGPQLTETIVLQGTFAANSSTESDEGTGKKLHSEFQFHADSMEMFTAFGREMKSPLQILEPAEASVHGSSRTIESGETTIEVRAAALTTMDFSLSMHNAALLIAILNSLEESFRAAEELSARKATEGPLSPKEQERIEHLASALEKIRADESIAYSESGSSLGDIDASSTFGLTATTASSTKYQLKVTMPETRITVVNDLQGMDEALFRVSVTNFVAGGEVLSPNFLFDFHCNTSILADYFDSSVNLWSRLLTKPWEITMKGSRAPSRRFKSDRLSSTLDLESFPCWVAFSEQFLVSLASAAQMWSIYTAAARGPSIGSFKQSSMTTTAARNLITSFPHAIANHCGLDVSFTLRSGSIKDRSCPNGHTQYFRFDPPTGRGYGGRRTYGQDVEAKKMIAIDVMGSVLVVNMDTELGHDRFPHELGDNLIIFTRAVKEGKTTVLHLTSHIEVINRTLIPFEIAVVGSEGDHEIGACRATNQAEITTSQSSGDGVDSKRTKSFSVPAPLLTDFATCWRKFGQAKLTLKITPLLSEVDANCISAINLSGSIDMVASLQQLKRSHGGHVTSKIDVQCCSKDQLGRNVHPFALQVVLKIRLIEDEHVCIDVYLEPRAVIENKIPLAIKIRTPMPQIFSTSQKEEGEHMEVTYDLDTNGRVEVFTPGPSIAISVRTRDKPIAGSELGWLDGGWVDLPLVPEFSLVDPIVGVLPFENSRKLSFDGARRAQGAEIFVVEGFQALGNLSEMVSAPKQKENSDKALSFPVSKQGIEGPLSFFLTVCNYGVDHTGDLLFEKATSLSTTGSSMRMASVWQSGRAFGDTSFDRKSTTSFREDIGESLMQDISRGRESKSMIPQPFGAFSSSLHRRRISLLSNAQSPIRLLQMTIEGDEGLRRTMSFLIDDLPISDGGAATVPIFWEDRRPTGHFAYRCLVNDHQSEIHIIPEFLVFNGSRNVLLAKERQMPEIIVEAGEVGQLRAVARPDGLEISLNFIELECQTGLLQVGRLGLRVAMVKSYFGIPVGSVYVQTVIDTHGDSRLVVKVGDVKFGSLGSPAPNREHRMFGGDFCRFRVRWTELQLILNEVGEKERDSWNLGRKFRSPRGQPPKVSDGRGHGSSPTSIQTIEQPIMAMIFSRFTVDFQKVFKDGEKSRRASVNASPERSQISIIVHNVQIKDLTPDSSYPMVFDCTSDISFFDLCIRIRGPLDADLVKVDLFDLNLAHSGGKSEKMVLTTSEGYVWRMLDLINRILAAGGEVAGFELKFEEDENHGGYIIKIEDSSKSRSKDARKYKYTPPKADTLYDISLARVSPFTVVVSFRRSPELKRYKKASNAPGEALTNYFTRKLKFTIDKAELNFARYEDRSLKGPSDRLIETLSTVYVGRMKFKVVSLLTAASLQDWRYLAARDNGDDEYIEGDILRATGNLTGKSAGVVFRKVGQGLGTAIIEGTSFVGDGIEDATSKIGARRLGTGVSSVVTGVGHGVSDTVSGVGTGAGKFLQGAGQGVGHVFGGISGGALQIGKGIGRGITTGDGMAVVHGISKGAASVGGGIAQGAESAVMGTADGLFTAGRGLFSGVKNVSQGIGGAIRGKKPLHFQRKQQDGNG